MIDYKTFIDYEIKFRPYNQIKISNSKIITPSITIEIKYYMGIRKYYILYDTHKVEITEKRLIRRIDFWCQSLLDYNEWKDCCANN